MKSIRKLRSILPGMPGKKAEALIINGVECEPYLTSDHRTMLEHGEELLVGVTTLYIRITKPDNDALTKSPSNTFPYENRTLTYSIKKYIEYNGEEQTINVFWDVEEFLYAGAYRVDIFADGTMIGSQKFTLD